MACCGRGLAAKVGATGQNPVILGAPNGRAGQYVRVEEEGVAGDYKAGSFCYVSGEDVDSLIAEGKLTTYEDVLAERLAAQEEGGTIQWVVIVDGTRRVFSSQAIAENYAALYDAEVIEEVV